MSQDEAAAYLRVTKRTVFNWVQKGRLRAFRIGHNNVLIPKADVLGIMTPVKPVE